ncbi:MAG: DEAD/DEAH box helicase, partial [Phycisphaerae bacterium]
MRLRPYQEEAVAAVYRHLRERDDHPCVVIPTAGGKTPVMAAICRDAVSRWGGRVLILAHVKELLEQAVEKLHTMAPDLWMHIGVYSAGLRSRDTEHPIIVAGIQSVYRRAAELDRFDLILIDECHLIPPDGEGMYRTFLADARVVNPNVRLVGLTATPHRMTTGMICDPDHLLNEVCYEVGVRELIVQGYLCPLKTKAGRRKVDTGGLHIRGGEFIAGEVEALMDDDALVREACAEIVRETRDRHSVLIFAAGVAHARHVQRALGDLGEECGLVTGETPALERAGMLDRFREGALKYLANVNVLTTGFDAPNIDCVAMLRPTNSPGLYYQMVGRGFRLHPTKENCLVLDFGGNILRHGPVDALEI